MKVARASCFLLWRKLFIANEIYQVFTFEGFTTASSVEQINTHAMVSWSFLESVYYR